MPPFRFSFTKENSPQVKLVILEYTCGKRISKVPNWSSEIYILGLMFRGALYKQLMSGSTDLRFENPLVFERDQAISLKSTIIIIIISFITVFAGVLFLHQPGTNHAPRASVTRVNHSVHYYCFKLFKWRIFKLDRTVRQNAIWILHLEGYGNLIT